MGRGAPEFALAAQIAKQGGGKGLMFDTEQYNDKLFYYEDQKHKATKTYAEYRTRVRQCGRQWMKAVNAPYPDVTLLLTYAYAETGRFGTTCGPRWNASGLLADFLDGMLDVCTPQTKIVDAWENAYRYKQSKEFAEAYDTIRAKATWWTGVPDKYSQHVRAGFGIWMDANWPKVGWHTDEFSKNYFSPAQFEATIGGRFRPATSMCGSTPSSPAGGRTSVCRSPISMFWRRSARNVRRNPAPRVRICVSRLNPCIREITMSHVRFNRRTALRTLAASGWAAAFGPPAFARSRSPNEKLNIAVVGCGNRGAQNIMGDVGRNVQFVTGFRQENIVALCDVDERQAARVFSVFPRVPKFQDFRKMLATVDQQIDAVVVCAPDHIHAPASMMAMKMGKHCYCEKPLTHSVYEARVMAKVAAEQKVATQMGTQIHASENYRRVVELIRGGAIGACASATSGFREATTQPTGLLSGHPFPPDSIGTCGSVRRPTVRTIRGTCRTVGTTGGILAADRSAIWDRTSWTWRSGARSTASHGDRGRRGSPETGEHAVLSDGGATSSPCAWQSASRASDLGERPARKSSGGVDPGDVGPIPVRRAVCRREGNARSRLFQKTVVAGEGLRRLSAAAAHHSRLDRASRGMDRGLQDGQPHNLSFRLQRPLDRSDSLGQRGLPCADED